MTVESLETEDGIRVNMNPDTGMPELPEGYYWEIDEEWLAGRSYLRVSLRKKRKRLWDARIDDRLVTYANVTGWERECSLEQRLLGAATNIFLDHRSEFAPDYAWEEAKKFIGKYPPNKLDVETWTTKENTK